MAKKKTYTLAELVSQCDPDAPFPKELRDWEEAESFGREKLMDENQRRIDIEEDRREEPGIPINPDKL
ncbi:hypothetical protein DET50_113114 [Marinobacter pelagius]|uniref:Uncharacterized protein n=1 Tax=Marinobacter pelagius TaxID=379482 RepID=A0A366GLG1_9GAMM|nr:hypothetical protein [Marinobacter pelagius]RBP27913.1 hypothetical protein DET50_113114 [Marinobacter pelagius]